MLSASSRVLRLRFLVRTTPTQKRAPFRKLLSLIALLLLLGPAARAVIPASERNALIELYNATNGSGWTESTNWMGVPGTECSWFGVMCDPGGTHVSAIYLGENGLSGSLPSSLSDLSDLTILDLPRNNLTGAIPSAIWTIPNLFHLSLMENDLTGTIDPQPTMRTLLLGWNRLSGGIESICDCPEIIDINLSNNQFTGSIPSCFGSLTDIFSLAIDDNLLTGSIPSEIGNLNALLRLSLTGNQLDGTIPPTIGNLTSLEQLSLGENNLSGSIPSQIGNLASLSNLVLGRNQLTGQIPPEMGNLTGLTYLAIGRNQLSGQIPPELGNLPKLQHLTLSDNELSGPIPPGLGDLSNLQSLSLLKNQLSGSIPPELGKLSNLLNMNFYGNLLTGPIPPEIGDLSKLTRLSLHDNYLAGPIPLELGNLTSLEQGGLRLGYNALYTDNEFLRDFLNSVQDDGDFEATQTVPPTNLLASPATFGSVSLQWFPIRYTGDDGGYQVHVATAPSGPFTLVTTTRDKAVSGTLVTSLAPSTTYYFKIATITYPHDIQQNTIVSESSDVVSATTAAPQAEVVVTSRPAVMSAFADGVSIDSTRFTIANFGQAGTTVTLTQSGTFFTLSTVSVTLGPGSTESVAVESLPQTATGAYRGNVSLSGIGTSSNLILPVTLFAAPSPPTGNPRVQVESTRIDVSAPIGTDPSGAVEFRNVGDADATGVLGSDQPWIVPDSSIFTIAPGETRTMSFVIDRAKRADADALSGSQRGTLFFIYLAGTGNSFSSRNPFDSAPTLVVPVSISDTVTPEVASCPPDSEFCPFDTPALLESEVGLVIPGVGNVTGSVGVFISDLTIGNPGGLPILDLALYYGNATTQLALDPGRSLALADVAATVFDKSEYIGSLHVRSARALEIAVNANVFVKTNPAGTFGTALPVFRTDRGATNGEVLTITGLRKTATSHTNLYLQEVAGPSTAVQVEFLDSDGSVIGLLPDQAVAGFGTTIVGQSAVPEGSVTARVTNLGEGAIAAYATPVDRASNDTWVVADWNQVYGFDGTERQIVAVAGSAPGRNETYFQTDLAVYSESSGTATLRYHQQAPEVSINEQIVLFAAGETKEFDDVVTELFAAQPPSLGFIELVPQSEHSMTMTSRTYTTTQGSPATFGTGVPTLTESRALRPGQSVVIGGLEDSTAKTTNAHSAATFRTNVGLVEVLGASAKVRVSVLLFDGTQLAAGGSTASRTYDLAPYQWHQLNAIVSEILGSETRESDYGELRNVQVRVEVVEGDGAVIVYATQTDNGTGDTVLRFE